jgi:hypothetical protein
MKPATLKQLKDELKHKSESDLLELILRLARFKKENKELLTYLLFEEENEELFITTTCLEVSEMFDEINTASTFYIRKSVRKILSYCNRLIRYSGKKETQVEILLHFCLCLKELASDYSVGLRVENVLDNQIIKIEKVMVGLHEDLQYEYNQSLDKLR